MNRLWVRLSLAFSAVILLAVAVVTLAGVLINNAGVQRFFVVNELNAPRGVMDELTAYFQEYGNWEGVEGLLTARDRHMPRGSGGGLAFFLADAEGGVVYDAFNETVGQQLAPFQLQQAVPIMVGGQVRGFLGVMPVPGDMPENQSQFLLGVLTRLVIATALVGGAVGILFGVAVSRSLTAPLGRLAEAARAIGERRLYRRVEVTGSAEVVELAMAFNDMAVALEQAETLRRNLVADVAHELRTPLTVLQGNLRAILDEVYPLSEAEIARLYDQTRLLSRLVNDLHELSQAEARQLPLNLQPADLGRVIEDTVATFAPLAEGKGVSLAVEVAADLPRALADPTRISQVLHNLLDNALRHTPEGGTITLGAEGDGDAVRLTIRDTGEGIPPEHLPHVFERFYRIDRARSRDTGGTGLGLAIVRAIVEAHGGSVSVASEGVPGLGTTFTVRLPVGEEATGQTAAGDSGA